MTEPTPACECACTDPARFSDAVEATVRRLVDEGRLHGVIVRDERRGRAAAPTTRGEV